jgi:hypothetical protein
MVEHDELIRRAVEGLRASRNPTPGAESRVFAALELQLGGPPGGGFDPSGGGGGAESMGGGSVAASGSAGAGASTAPVTIGWVAKVIGATAGMTAGGLLLVRVGVGAVQAISGDGESTRDDAVETAEAEPADIRTTQADAEPTPPVEDDTPAISVHPGASTKPSVEPSVEVEQADALAAELSLVGLATRAITPNAALVLLEQHAREYPNGTMASEREALAVVALCQLDRTEEARTRARILVAQRPGLPLLHRVRSECPALSDLLRQIAPP